MNPVVKANRDAINAVILTSFLLLIAGVFLPGVRDDLRVVLLPVGVGILSWISAIVHYW